MNWVNLQLDELPKLLDQGWRIDIDDDFRMPVVETNQWNYVIGENEKTDWFDLGINAEVAGKKIDIIPALLILMESYPEGLPDKQDCPQYFSLALDDGHFIRISADRLRYIFNTLLEFFSTGKLNASGKISLHRFKLSRFATLKKDSEDLLKLNASNNTLALVDQLQNIEKISPVTPPNNLNATLRPYQQQGLNWLQFLRQHRLGGILADDMGLGKTLQALAHIQMEKEQGRLENPALVVVPTSLLFNWRQEASRFTPDLKVLTLHGSQRHELFSSVSEHDLILTTYPLLHRDEAQLVENEYHLLILDEAQIIKNPSTKASLTVRNLVATHRICLTGTPIENHLGELWSLFNFLMPELFGNYRLFQRIYRIPIENGNEEKARQLSKLIRPFLMRRTKENVAPELPRKTEIIIKAVFEGPQRELYESIRLAMHDEIKEEIKQLGIARSHIVVMNALLKLRQICCDPHLLDYKKYIKTYQGDSAKLELLMNMLTELIEEGRRVLLFSQFTSMLNLIENKLALEKISYLKLTGKTMDRERVVTQFQNREVPLLLISLKAGGVGLNLTEADTVIHYDPWWNPAIEQQASARAHRIGQKNPVFVYKLICQDTVEEKIQHMQQSKQAIVDALYDSKGGSEAQWNQNDIDELFGEHFP